MHHWSDSPTLRFTVPVIAENMATTSINMVVSSIIGGISASALAGVGLVNSFLNVITAAAAFLTTGAAVLVARIAGEGDEHETSRAVGQAFLLAVLFGVAIMAICEILSAPIVKLMMNSSDENVLREGLIYYRTMIASFPLLLIANTMGGALRATGDAAPVMRGMIVMNLVQLLCVWLFVGRMGMEVAGAGLAHGVCRLTGAGLIKMYPRKWTDERVQNPDMKTIRVHRIPFCGQVRAKTLNSGQIGCEKLDSAETDVYNCIIKEG